MIFRFNELARFELLIKLIGIAVKLTSPACHAEQSEASSALCRRAT